ncbi:hypothetical protein [Halogeometricum limi]|uniref:Uncharacterized protein n=1 Tax=Halogeometricum limi TaxID=555875 RepID=A0A1I6HCW0_9EURY|nr:hypothetical protein [Halogeometricum limi]SFR52190.1 hypothetical protein SAMN04488124_2062 [Halogeometricum limi]
MPRTRRTLLRQTGLALGGGVLATLAGCLGGSTGGTVPAGTTTETAAKDSRSPDGRGGSADAVERTTAAFEWLPDPRRTPLRDGYGVRYSDLAAIRRYREALHPNAFERLRQEAYRAMPSDELVDVADVDATLRVGFHATIALGSFDPDAIDERLRRDRRTGDSRTATTGSGTATPMETPTTATRTPRGDPERYRGFALYDGYYAYAVSEDAVLAVSSGRDDDTLARAKAIIDTKRDEEAPYPDGNAYVEAMLGLVHGAHALTCYPEAMDGSSSRGFRKDAMTGQLKSWRFDAETTHFTLANTYADTETTAAADLAAHLDDESARFGPYEGLGVETDGRLTWADGTIPTGEFDFLSPGGPNDGVTTENG